jgi:alpha,alpha-trehalose phosphorylase
MRDHDDELSFAPRLPDGLERLAFPVAFRGLRLKVEVTPRDATYSLLEGAIHISHWGERIDLIAGTPATRPVPPAPRLPAPSQPAGRAPARRLPAPRDE